MSSYAFGYEWWFAHLSHISSARSIGESVIGGTVLGKTGNTGNSTGPHLHVALLAEPLRGRKWGSVPFLDPWAFVLEAWVEGRG